MYSYRLLYLSFFFCQDAATTVRNTDCHTLSLHGALAISTSVRLSGSNPSSARQASPARHIARDAAPGPTTRRLAATTWAGWPISPVVTRRQLTCGSCTAGVAGAA